MCFSHNLTCTVGYVPSSLSKGVSSLSSEETPSSSHSGIISFVKILFISSNFETISSIVLRCFSVAMGSFYCCSMKLRTVVISLYKSAIIGLTLSICPTHRSCSWNVATSSARRIRYNDFSFSSAFISAPGARPMRYGLGFLKME